MRQPPTICKIWDEGFRDFLEIAVVDDLETILIVEDEESVRRTFLEWLQPLEKACHILTAADAEAALRHANAHTIDLAILDWNLGTGSDGLQLLEDLYLFNPDLSAIMVTGYAHQATPLHALRMGVRDYLDKNQNLDRNVFLTTVHQQLERIRPARRERRLNKSLKVFRETLEKVLPLVQSATRLRDQLTLPDAVKSFLRFLQTVTHASQSALVIRSSSTEVADGDLYKAYDSSGAEFKGLIPFSQSLASLAMSMQRPLVLKDLVKEANQTAVQMQSFECSQQALLAVPFQGNTKVQFVVELFRGLGDPPFSETDQGIAAAAAEIGAHLFRESMAEQRGREMLLDAVCTALEASEHVSNVVSTSPSSNSASEPLPEQVFEQLRVDLRGYPDSTASSEEILRLVDAIRVLAARHGVEALRHCIHLVDGLRQLLDTVTASGENRA